MKKQALLIFTLLLAFHSGGHASENYINKKSPYSVEKTLDRLEQVLKSRGITLFARIDHDGGAKKVGIKMQPTRLLIFGNPKMGTPLMKENRMMALDLPMKALAWQDSGGQVWLSYLKPSVLQKRHQLKNLHIIDKMSKALNAMTDLALKK